MRELIRPRLHRPRLLTPRPRSHPLYLPLGPGRITRGPIEFEDWKERITHALDAGGRPLMAGGASFSDYCEGKVLEHVAGKSSFTMPSFYVALCTAEVTDAKTGATITEANYTGYARKKVEAADWQAASGGSIKNENVITFAECTASTSTITYWAGCDSVTTGAGNVLAWGTCTSTVISTTQTPPTIAKEQLVVTLD